MTTVQQPFQPFPIQPSSSSRSFEDRVQAESRQSSSQEPHSFDRATQATPLSSPPVQLQPILAQLAEQTSFYEVNIDPSYGSTIAMPNGGYLGSVILSSCLLHQSRRKQSSQDLSHTDPLSITFDYQRPSRPGPAWIAIKSFPKGSASNTAVTAYMYQVSIDKKAAAAAAATEGDKTTSNPPTKVVMTISASAVFGDQSKQSGMTVLPLHYGKVPDVDQVPVPHPKSWYLPPDKAMISKRLDLLVELETKRRPFADYFIRFHPTSSSVTQQDDWSGDDQAAIEEGQAKFCKGSRKLPLRSSDSRRIDTKSLPTIADFRRPAVENVLKKDPESELDEPVRGYGYPTTQLTLRFLRTVPEGVEWVHTSWRESVINGRVVSDIRIATEDGVPIVIGQMDSLMFDMRWYKM
ncbi:hypothetical protein IE53DRAFT_390271 [Violaceomyces palustris]|uniref:Uncharacterized protein n=1 Tax=Violaceomyces palustris TaxID=1673888 RepID=A0ACD0NP53_9BASI|nr:hypothetical protein IE53DRAFT_390271 [Violaceomyces palustris]